MHSKPRQLTVFTMWSAALALAFAAMLPPAGATLNNSHHNPEASLPLSTAARWLRRVRSDRYSAPDPAWLRRFADAVPLGSASDDDAWRALGFEPRRTSGSLWLRETAPAAGRGAYALRDSSGLLLQAPHADTDVGTGEIALRLFEETHARALALNNVRRDTAPGADQARSPLGPFVRMATALAEQDPALCVVQLHGFSHHTAKRLTLSTDAIVVGGGSDDHNASLAACLRKRGFPAQATSAATRDLAGRGNAVGIALQRLGRGRFIHLELGPDQRDRLLRDSTARSRLWQCL